MTNEQAREIGKILDRIKRKKGFDYAPTVHELQELLQQEYIKMKAYEYLAFGDMSTRDAYIDGYKQALKDNNL